MEAAHAFALLGLAPALVLAGQVVGVGLRHREGNVFAPQALEDLRLVVAGLVPGAEHERCRRPRLASDALGQAAQYRRRARAREHAQAQLGPIHLDAPCPRRTCAEVEPARLRVVHQHSVTGARQQPRHGEIGGIVARAKAPGRDEERYEGALVGLEGALGHVALHLAPALVDGVGALAEAQVALAAASAKADAEPGRPPRPPSGHLHSQRDHTLPVGLDAQRQTPAEWIVGGELGQVGAARAPAPQHPRGPHPAVRPQEAQAGARQPAQDHSARAVEEHEAPGIAAGARAKRAGSHLLRPFPCARRRGVEGEHGERDAERGERARRHARAP